MSQENCTTDKREMTSIFERYLTVWEGLCIVGGILLGKIAPDLAKTLDGMSINVGVRLSYPSPLLSAFSLAGIAFIGCHLCDPTLGSRISFEKMDYCGQRGNMVQGTILRCSDPR